MVDDSEWAGQVRRALPLARRLEFELRNIDDVEALATLLSSSFPRPELRIAGLIELLLNAVEHGNLGVSAAEKQALLVNGRWRAELERRLDTEPWRQRVARVTLTVQALGWELVIEDGGDGFELPPAPDASPMQLRGRGVALARAAFDAVRWEGKGNRVVAWVAR